jgi:tRNA dimethylallyltransferase
MAGEWSLEQGVERAVFASRQLAKRQLTWLRSQDDARWFESGDKTLEKQAITHVRRWMSRS